MVEWLYCLWDFVCVCGGVLEGTEYVAEGTIRKKERGKG